MVFDRHAVTATSGSWSPAAPGRRRRPRQEAGRRWARPAPLAARTPRPDEPDA